MKLVCAVVGDNGCGKTCLLKSYLQPKVLTDSAYHPTAVEKYLAKVTQPRRNLSVELEFLEIGGGLKDRSQHYSNVDLVILCFSVVSQESFDNVGKWVHEIERQASGAALLLVGCKRDLRVESETFKQQKHISTRSGQAKSKSLGAVGYLECSALHREGIKEIFDHAISAVPRHRASRVGDMPAGRRAGDDDLDADKDDFAFLDDDDDMGDPLSARQQEPQKGLGVIRRGLVGLLMGGTKPADAEPADSRTARRGRGRMNGQYGEKTGDALAWSADGSDSETVVQLIRHVTDIVDMTPTPPAPAPPPLTNGFVKPVSLDKLLARKDVALQDLMDEDLRTDLMREFRLRNKTLLEFLSRQQTLLELVSYITKGPASQEQFCAVELLTAEIPSILDTLCSEGVLSALFELLTVAPPMPPWRHQAADYFKRIICFVLSSRNKPDLVWFLKWRPSSCQEFVDHLATPAVVALLLQCLQPDRAPETQEFIAVWSAGLLRCLEERVQSTPENPDHEEDYVAGLLELVTQLVSKNPSSPLLKGLQELGFVRPALRQALDESSGVAIAYMRIVTCLVDACRNPDAPDPMSLSPPPPEPPPPALIAAFIEPMFDPSLASPPSASSLPPPLPSPSTSDRISPLQKLHQLLHRPAASLPPSLTTPAGVVAPFGMFRIKCVELLLALLKTNYGVLDRAMIDDRLVARCLDLFFQFKWNNVLHGLVYQMASLVLTTKSDFFCFYLLRDCRLLDRILQVQQNDEQEIKMRGQQDNRPVARYAYMGHLYLIANCIVSSSRNYACLFYLLEDTPGWRKFENKLKLLNQASMPDAVVKPEKKPNNSLFQSFTGGLRLPSLSD
eukprot:TRINITY_DN23041_c0_g1_i1.p1 TRINITY_DN23041_c0_g1~~TRINITY_DN23041_c0_g1_i1.p1  ORF type:complete len:845 (-),score=245.55 TRINITY_DN23041_c0_g1_i1:154-2688(-)